MATYTPQQIDRYLSHIGYPRAAHSADRTDLLSQLTQRHRAVVPFESLDLHYTCEPHTSLDPEVLFLKVVERGRGGYCMEVTTLFGCVLRSLGFDVLVTGARVWPPGNSELTGWSHMVLIVTISVSKFYVDVGYGAYGPPVPMILSRTSDPAQPTPVFPFLTHLQYGPVSAIPGSPSLWTYSYESPPGSGAVVPGCCFYDDVPFIVDDFAIINSATIRDPDSFFVKCLFAQRAVWDEERQQTEGTVNLFGDTVRRLVGKDGTEEVVERFTAEAERVKALERLFGVRLTREEREGIVGRGSCLALQAEP